MIIRQLAVARQSSARRSAFTLLEVLVVVAIIIVLAGIATVYVPKYLDDSRKDRARIDCKTIEKAVETYFLKAGDYPADLSEVAGYITGGIPQSPWPSSAYSLVLDDSTGQTRAVISITSPDGTVISSLATR